MSSDKPPSNPSTYRPPSLDDDLGADVTSPGTMSLGVGQKVFSHFTLKRLLGQGAMGMVWLAHNGNLNREVALKFLPQVLATDSLVLDELRRETLRCLDLSHHHIVRVYGLELGDAGTGAGGKLAAIHMEFVDGLTLRELMHKRVKEEGLPPIFEVDEISAWVQQLCDALHYAHTKAKVAHRDLKPSNIMVNSAGEAKLADFGVARKIVDNLAQVTNLIVGTGTTAYMSPQQMNGGVPHPTDDVYSLGATIFELLTSKPPFFSGDMRHQVSQVAPTTMTERREQLGFTECEAIPEVWERTVAACLAKSPEDRPQSCEEVAKMLRGDTTPATAVSFDKRGPATQRPTSRPTAAKPAAPAEPPPRKGFPLMPVAAGVVVLLALVGVGIWLKDKPGKVAPVIPPPAPAVPEAKAPVEPPPAAPQFGAITVVSEPAGAEVIFDGRKTLRTPTSLTNIQTGTHTLLFRMPNHEEEFKEFALTNAGPLEVKVILKRHTGQVSVESTPDKSDFIVSNAADGIEVARGKTPFKTNLATGRYTVVLKRPDHADRVETLTIEAGALAQFSHTFPMGAMDLRSTPPGLPFEVFRGTNRVFTGVTPTNFSDLPAGSYRVAMKRPGFAPFEDTVAVLKGILTPINWNSTDNVLRGAFNLTTTPTNASAIIEGQAPRYTPALFASLTPGKYTVNFRLPGYESETREFEVQGGVTNSLPPIALKRSTGTLQIASTPANLPYEIQPVNVLGGPVEPKKGNTKAAPEALALPTGTYLVKLQRSGGWEDFSKEVVVSKEQPASVTHEFPEGTIEVAVQPAVAALSINGKAVAKFPVALPPGPHEIVATHAKLPNLVTNVALKKGEKLVVPLVFPSAITVTVDPPGAEVFVAGVSRGKATPTLELAGFPPGAVSLEAKLAGYEPASASVTVGAGERKDSTMKLAKAKVVVAPKLVPVPTPPPVEPKTPPVKPVQEAKVVMPEKKAGSPPSATTQQWVNSLGMEFVAVPGVKGLICVHETRVQDYQGFAKDKDLAWDPVAGQTGDHPAVNVFWTEARQFCAWLTAKERQAGTISAAQTYRLPTDLEWSAAVGMSPEKGKDPAERSKTAQYGGGPAARPWTVPWNAEDGFTADQPPKAEAGNYHASVGVDKFTNTSPVRSFKPNRFGLYDMGGNAWEWCEDEFTKGGGTYVMRGGSWKTELEKPVRDTFTRTIIAPAIFKMLSGYRFPGAIALPDTGFRIVLDAGQ